jgi:hypothetical protein
MAQEMGTRLAQRQILLGTLPSQRDADIGLSTTMHCERALPETAGCFFITAANARVTPLAATTSSLHDAHRILHFSTFNCDSCT